MASLVAPRCHFWLQINAADSLGQIHLALLQVGTLLHELVVLGRLEHCVENFVNPVDEVVSVASLKDLYERLKDTLRHVHGSCVVTCLQELQGHGVQERVEFS